MPGVPSLPASPMAGVTLPKPKKKAKFATGKMAAPRLDRASRKPAMGRGMGASPMSSAAAGLGASAPPPAPMVAKAPMKQPLPSDNDGDESMPLKTGGKAGHLNAAGRRALPSEDFALPGKGKGPEGKGSGSYPIDTEARARSALARGKANASPEEQATIRRKVHAKYPGMEVKGAE